MHVLSPPLGTDFAVGAAPPASHVWGSKPGPLPKRGRIARKAWVSSRRFSARN